MPAGHVTGTWDTIEREGGLIHLQERFVKVEILVKDAHVHGAIAHSRCHGQAVGLSSVRRIVARSSRARVVCRHGIIDLSPCDQDGGRGAFDKGIRVPR